MLKRRSPWFFAPGCFCFFFGDSKQSERMWSKNWTARRPKIPKLECILPESQDVLRLWLFEEILWLPLRVNFTVGCRMHRFILLSSSFLQAGFRCLNFTFFKCLQLCSWESSQIFTGSQFPPRPSPVKRRWNEASERCRPSNMDKLSHSGSCLHRWIQVGSCFESRLDTWRWASSSNQQALENTASPQQSRFPKAKQVVNCRFCDGYGRRLRMIRCCKLWTWLPKLIDRRSWPLHPNPPAMQADLVSHVNVMIYVYIQNKTMMHKQLIPAISWSNTV